MEAVLSAIDSIAHLMDDHGWAVISFLFILFIWFIPWVRGMQKKEKETTAPDIIPTAIEQDIDIMLLLNQMTDIVGAQWGILWQFFNGVYSTCGIPFFKMSITNEVTRDGVAGRMQDFQNIPIVVFADLVKDINKAGCVYVTQAENKYKSVCTIYKKEGIACGYYFKIINSRNEFTGVLSVTFVNETTLSAVKLLELQVIAQRMAILMSDYSRIKINRRKKDLK